MKKHIFTSLLITLVSFASVAQGQTRAFDNFDSDSGIRVVKPTVAPMMVTSPKKLVKKTASVQLAAAAKPTRTMSVSDGLGSKSLQSVSAPYMTMGSSRELRGFTTGDAAIDSYIVNAARVNGIDPLLIYAQMSQESSFKLRATSNKGASGLMQLMPATARRWGVTNIYDPQQNIDAGVKYMRWLLNTFGGDISLALAGYNAGEGAVMKYGNSIPPYRETQEYVRRITARYASISDPKMANVAKRVSSTTAVRLENKDSRPLTAYDPGAIAIKLPDGRMRLVNQ